MTMGLRITNGKSLLAGSLTLSKQVVLTLTYPIQEVLSALSRMMSHHVSSTPGITPDQFTHHTTHHTVTVYTARHHINSIFWASVMDPLRFHTLCAHFLQTSRKKMHLCEIVEARNIKMFINFPNVLMWDSQCNRHVRGPSGASSANRPVDVHLLGALKYLPLRRGASWIFSMWCTDMIWYALCTFGTCLDNDKLCIDT